MVLLFTMDTTLSCISIIMCLAKVDIPQLTWRKLESRTTCNKDECIEIQCHHHHHHHLFAQSSSNSHVQQCNIVEKDSKVQERTPTAARKKEAWYDRNALHNQSTLQIRKLEKSTLAILDLKTDNFEKFTVDGNAFQTLITRLYDLSRCTLSGLLLFVYSNLGA